MNAYTIRYNRTTNHISGLDASTISNEYTMNACGSLTRSNLATGKTLEDVKEALELAKIVGGRKLCKNCEKAARAMIEALEAAEVAEVEIVAENAPPGPGPDGPGGLFQRHHGEPAGDRPGRG